MRTYLTVGFASVLLAIGGCPMNQAPRRISTDTGAWRLTVAPPPAGTRGNLEDGAFTIDVASGSVLGFLDMEGPRAPSTSALADSGDYMLAQWTVETTWMGGEPHALQFVLEGTQAEDGSYTGHGRVQIDDDETWGLWFILQPK